MTKKEILNIPKRGGVKKKTDNELKYLKRELKILLEDMEEEIEEIYNDEKCDEKKLLDLCDFKCSVNLIYTEIQNEMYIRRLNIDRFDNKGYYLKAHSNAKLGYKSTFPKER